MNTIRTLQDALWATDGHHHTLAERSCNIPEVFHRFTGYNQPKLSKHWKQQVESLSIDTLWSHSQQLFGNLQSGFWDRSTWVGLKAEVKLLAKSLAKYANQQNDTVASAHSSQEPIVTLGTPCSQPWSVQYVGPRYLQSWHILPLQ